MKNEDVEIFKLKEDSNKKDIEKEIKKLEKNME